MSKKTGMNGYTFKKKKSYKKKKASSREMVNLCSPKVKNIVEMFLLYIKFCLVKLWLFAFSKQSTPFWLIKKDKNLTKPNQSAVDIGIDTFYIAQRNRNRSWLICINEEDLFPFYREWVFFLGLLIRVTRHANCNGNTK